MATNYADMLTQLCADVLKCEICTEHFDHDRRLPRVLTCHHCFCGTCTEKLGEGGSFKCPKCQALSPAKLPVETTRMALLDKKRALQSQGGVGCEGCTEGATATSRCQDCEHFLCDFCSAAHPRLTVFKGHRIVSLTEAWKNPEKLLQTSEKCQQHPDKKLELYCVTCCKAVCSMCALTLHQGHKLAEVSGVLDQKKEELLKLCQQLDEVEQSFRAKAEQSEAMVAAVEDHLNAAVLEVDSMFADVISRASKRQAEVVDELRARAKCDQVVLEQEAATFRSLQAAAHSTAQFGRTCVSLSLASQVFSQAPELQRRLEELEPQTSAEVSSAPKYEIMTDKLAELEELMKEIGKLGGQQTASAAQCPPDEPEPVAAEMSFPSIQLDRSRCGDGCQVGADNCSLSNQPCTHSRSHSQTQRFIIRGTCGTAALPDTSCYWQARAVLTPKPTFKDNIGMCVVGVATQEALQRCSGSWIAWTGHYALTAWIYTEKGQVKVVVLYRGKDLSRTALAPCTSSRPVELTLGFLLDTATARLHVLDVKGTRLLCSSDLDLSQPVWPIVCMYPEYANGAGVEVEVQSGQKVAMTGDLRKLLQSLLGSGSQ